MDELIDRTAFVEHLRDKYCKVCNKRMGMKNGKYRECYEIGDAPCRSCEMDDFITELENYHA